jgi:hypothetical protein
VISCDIGWTPSEPFLALQEGQSGGFAGVRRSLPGGTGRAVPVDAAMKKPTHRTTSTCATLFATLGFVGTASADTLWIEAESGRNFAAGSISSPFIIADDPAASDSGYITVQAGKNSTTAVPTTGIASYKINVVNAGTYRIWGRVIAPTTQDDSFYVRMDGGAWISWNDMPFNSAWHWDRVHPPATTTPSSFSLAAGAHTLQVAYREDGAKLDVMVLTNDNNYSPNVSPLGDPPPPAKVTVTPSKGALLVSWSNVPRTFAYTILRRLPGGSWVNWESTPNHSFTDPVTAGTNYCYSIISDGADGTTTQTTEVCGTSASNIRLVSEPEKMSLTSPMQATTTGVHVAAGNNSLTAAPATGYARHDFRLGVGATVKIWGSGVAPSVNDDSFWVRMDRGAWINWNGFKPSGTCGWDDVHDANNGNLPSSFTLAAGSHTLEFAYREDGTDLNKVLISDSITTTVPTNCY